MTSPLVSVLIPCFNCENYVETAVRSIMNQTYRNLEIIVTDDNSSDGSWNILQKLAEEDERIRLFRNPANLKIVKTLNEMVSAAHGEYIARMDADDVSLPNRMEKQIAFLESHPDVALCGTNAWHINEAGRRTTQSLLPVFPEECRFFLRYFSVLYHPSILARAAVLKENQYSAEFPHAEDYELWCRLVYQKQCIIANLPEKLLLYRIGKNSITSKYNKEQCSNSAKIFDQLPLVSSLNRDMHKKIFFTLEPCKSSLAFYQYTVTLFGRLHTRSWSSSSIPAKKILFYCFIQKFVFLFFMLALTPLGIYSCCSVACRTVRKALS